MKTFLTLDSHYGPATQYLVQWMLQAYSDKFPLRFVEKADDAELIIVVGEFMDESGVFEGKKLFVGSLESALSDREAFLKKALLEAKIYLASPKPSAPAHQKKTHCCYDSLSYWRCSYIPGGRSH